MDGVICRVLDLASRHALAGRPLEDPDADLAAAGIDSLTLAAFVVDVEATFGITFAAEDMEAAVFQTPRTVAQAVASRLRDGS